eukprot:Gb_09156 [translate_table: standard]
MSTLEEVVMEIVITFALVYTVYATVTNPKKGFLGTIAPIIIGFIVGANILVASPFSSGSMNPALLFGSVVALMSQGGKSIALSVDQKPKRDDKMARIEWRVASTTTFAVAPFTAWRLVVSSKCGKNAPQPCLGTSYQPRLLVTSYSSS